MPLIERIACYVHECLFGEMSFRVKCLFGGKTISIQRLSTCFRSDKWREISGEGRSMRSEGGSELGS